MEFFFHFELKLTMSAELTPNERFEEYLNKYLTNNAPETSIRKTIKPGRDLLTFARQHCEESDNHYRYGGYFPTQGFKLKQDISDIICYYIEDAHQLVPRRVIDDYEWLLDKLDDKDMFHSSDENEINKFRRLYQRYHIKPRMPTAYYIKFDDVKLTQYNATRLNENHVEIKNKYDKFNNYCPNQSFDKFWLQ